MFFLKLLLSFLWLQKNYYRGFSAVDLQSSLLVIVSCNFLHLHLNLAMLKRKSMRILNSINKFTHRKRQKTCTKRELKSNVY